MRANVHVRCHFGGRTILRAFLKGLPPAQLWDGNVSCTVDVEVRLEAALQLSSLNKKRSQRLGGRAGIIARLGRPGRLDF